MTFKERIAHHLIGTPLFGPAQRVRSWRGARNRRRHPELAEIYAEGKRIDQAMRRLIQDPMNCIDVGCHLGSVLSQMCRLSPHGTHLAIEPTPYKAAWLKQKFATCEIHQMALSDKAGQSTFYHVPRRSGYNGLRRPSGKKGVQSFTVRCERLDVLVPIDRPVGFIKIDVEGGELNVLRGATDLLERCRPTILFECTMSGLTAFEYTPSQVFNFLTQQGYGIHLVKNYLADQNTPLPLPVFEQAMRYPFQAFNFLGLPSRE